MSFSKRIRDLIVEVLIAIVLVTGLIAYKVQHPNTEINWTRIALILNTAIVFGYLIAWFRDAWTRILFWAWLIAALLAHVAVYVLVLDRIGNFPLVYYAFLNAGELIVVTLFLRKMISIRQPGHLSSRRLGR